jgi:hypothetical protein
MLIGSSISCLKCAHFTEDDVDARKKACIFKREGGKCLRGSEGKMAILEARCFVNRQIAELQS